MTKLDIQQTTEKEVRKQEKQRNKTQIPPPAKKHCKKKIINLFLC
jgi:hypothetical protein